VPEVGVGGHPTTPAFALPAYCDTVDERRRACIGGAGDTRVLNLPLAIETDLAWELVKDMELVECRR
jgi:hypothetical protein